jgi:hypothetical protein
MNEERMNVAVHPLVLLSARKFSTGETRTVTLGADHPLILRIGARSVPDLIHYLHFELEDNNWSCDCNRCLFFDDDFFNDCQESEYAVDWFSVDGLKFVSQDDYGRRFIQHNAKLTHGAE